MWCPQDIYVGKHNIYIATSNRYRTYGRYIYHSAYSPLAVHDMIFQDSGGALIPTLLSVASAADTLQEKPWDLVTTGEMVVIATQP